MNDEIKKTETKDNSSSRNIAPEKDTPVRKIVLISAVAVFVGCLVFLGAYFLEGARSNAEYNRWSQLQSSIANETTTPPSTQETSMTDAVKEKPLLPLAQEMLKENPDAAGWITIENTKINYPVVLRKSDDGNDFYLSHSFDGSENRKGAIFMDYRTTSDGLYQSDNIVLYGHNEAANDMFGDLDKYKNNGGADWSDKALEFYKENPTFQFSTNYDNGTYKIFAVFVTMRTDEYDDIPLFDYHNYIDFDQTRYDDFIDGIEKRNKLVTDVDYKFGDKFVTLSTCSNEANDARLVIVARRVRSGESSEVDTTGAEFNPSPYYEHNWTEIYKK